MGLSFSFFNSDNPDGYMVESKPGLGDLPESCVASILGYLEPTEICKLAKLNRAFRGASMADFVWESKLPSNYRVLVRKVLGDSVGNLGKREIYARLCRPNTLDEGTKVCFSSSSFFFFFNFWYSFSSCLVNGEIFKLLNGLFLNFSGCFLGNKEFSWIPFSFLFFFFFSVLVIRYLGLVDEKIWKKNENFDFLKIIYFFVRFQRRTCKKKKS